MIHLYCGDGKGKTTCAMGLALRALRRDWRVVIAQFLKSEDSGERRILSGLSGVHLLPLPPEAPFTFAMTEAERAEAAERASALLDDAHALLAPGVLLVLDEVCPAIAAGLLPLHAVTGLLDACPAGAEVVLTGRAPDLALVARADYITEMKSRRHPYESGARARSGIEF